MTWVMVPWFMLIFAPVLPSLTIRNSQAALAIAGRARLARGAIALRSNVFALPDLPLPAILALRRARTALLYAAGPFERALSKSARELPPLWLRRHAGPVDAFRSSADEAERLLVELDLVRSD